MACVKQIVRNIYQAEIRYLSYLQPVLLLALRLYFGYGFMKAGLGKLQDVSTTAGFFAEWGVPLPTLNVYLAGTTECVGGLLLLLGVASRVVTIPLIFTMLVAYATAHSDVVHALWSNPNLFVKAPPFLYLLTALLVLCFGPGLISIDGLIKWRLDRKGTVPGADGVLDNGVAGDGGVVPASPPPATGPLRKNSVG
jgi:putative oxidoreductase